MIGASTIEDRVEPLKSQETSGRLLNPSMPASDFSEASWFAADELIRKLRSGESAKSDLLIVAEKFLSDL